MHSRVGLRPAMTRPPIPVRHWRSYGDHPLPSGAEALDEPLRAFPSWFLRIVCERLLPFTEKSRGAWLVLAAFNGRAIGDEELTAIQVSRYTKCRKFFEKEIVLAKDEGVLDPTIDVVPEAIALASFVDGLAVHMLFLGRGVTKRAKQALVQRYLERNLAVPRAKGSARRNAR